MRTALLAAVIVALTAVAVTTIARRRNEALAGPGLYRLDSGHPRALQAWTALLERQRAVDARHLADRLDALREEGQVWCAPALDPGLRAIFVSTLGLVERVYVAERELLATPAELYPDLKVPPRHLEEFAWLTLSSTLLHELSHARGVASESGAYAEEIEWLQTLAARPDLRPLDSPERQAWDWARQTAIGNARKAREKALAGGN